MGKRRQPRPVGPRAVWNEEDVWAILGLLDFCIKHAHAFPFNEGNVVGRLRSAGSSHGGYTWDQINRKLKHLWKTLGSIDSLDEADIYVKGSACLAGLREDERSAIRSNVVRLEKLLKPVCLEPFIELHQARLIPSLH